jgi:hypothetical protein
MVSTGSFEQMVLCQHNPVTKRIFGLFHGDCGQGYQKSGTLVFFIWGLSALCLAVKRTQRITVRLCLAFLYTRLTGFKCRIGDKLAGATAGLTTGVLVAFVAELALHGADRERLFCMQGRGRDMT